VKFLRPLTIAAAGLAGLAGFAAFGAVPAQATTAQRPLTVSAHVPYEGCPAKDVVLSVTLSQRTYGLGQNVGYRIRLHNQSSQTCAPAGLPTTSAPHGLALGPALTGPCSAFPVVIEDHRGAQVSPGAEAISCPALMGPALAPHGTLTAHSSWDRVEGGDRRPARFPSPAPAGTYHLVVDGHVSLPFTLSNAAVPASFTATVAPTRTAHVAFGGCPARSIEMSVSFLPPPAGSRAVTFRVTLHNQGNRWCGPRDHTGSLDLGLCGDISTVVHNAAGVDVYPGHEVVFCPDFDGRGVAPHQSATGSSTWLGQQYLSDGGASDQSTAAPPGRYTLVVAGTLAVPFTLPT
jgi:hypothetical protein